MSLRPGRLMNNLKTCSLVKPISAKIPVRSPWSDGLFLLPDTLAIMPGGSADVHHVSSCGCWQERRQHLLIHKSSSLPPRRRFIEHIADGDTGVLGPLVELILENNVALDVAEDEFHLRFVRRVSDDGVNHLVHRCNAGAASNHTNFLLLVGLVLEFFEGPLHLHLVTYLHISEGLRNLALLIDLDN
eukprot:08185_5